ncbi:uncharacterized membrane protein (UPF0127 family) [Neisseria sp. HSC-16F19]|nr:DUF192 domain-containing protein [Neisseria sp. HSC-16F19]MCP2041514.1 uncharacterized membrane protein (UPF0127 family) [Neisseria sp. HSC-16F19]
MRLLGLVLLLALPAAQAATEWLPYHRARVGSHAIAVQVADTPAQQQRGLMGRSTLPPDTGMLFVYDAAHALCFWMRHTPLPLDIAFADAEGRIHTLAQMQPLSDTLHCADNAAYALEMPQGWFERKGIRSGDVIRWPLDQAPGLMP